MIKHTGKGARLGPLVHIFHPFFPSLHSVFSFSFQCFYSVMDVCEAQDTSLVFSIISLVNTPLCVFVEASPGSLPAHTLSPFAGHTAVMTNYTHLAQCAAQCMCKDKQVHVITADTEIQQHRLYRSGIG